MTNYHNLKIKKSLWMLHFLEFVQTTALYNNEMHSDQYCQLPLVYLSIPSHGIH